MIPGEFKNGASFLRLELPSTLIHPKIGAFRKCSSNLRNLKTSAFHFGVDENGAFRKRCIHDNRLISMIDFSADINPIASF